MKILNQEIQNTTSRLKIEFLEDPRLHGLLIRDFVAVDLQVREKIEKREITTIDVQDRDLLLSVFLLSEDRIPMKMKLTKKANEKALKENSEDRLPLSLLHPPRDLIMYPLLFLFLPFLLRLCMSTQRKSLLETQSLVISR